MKSLGGIRLAPWQHRLASSRHQLIQHPPVSPLEYGTVSIWPTDANRVERFLEPALPRVVEIPAPTLHTAETAPTAPKTPRNPRTAPSPDARNEEPPKLPQSQDLFRDSKAKREPIAAHYDEAERAKEIIETLKQIPSQPGYLNHLRTLLQNLTPKQRASLLKNYPELAALLLAVVGDHPEILKEIRLPRIAQLDMGRGFKYLTPTQTKLVLLIWHSIGGTDPNRIPGDRMLERFEVKAIGPKWEDFNVGIEAKSLPEILQALETSGARVMLPDRVMVLICERDLASHIAAFEITRAGLEYYFGGDEEDDFSFGNQETGIFDSSFSWMIRFNHSGGVSYYSR